MAETPENPDPSQALVPADSPDKELEDYADWGDESGYVNMGRRLRPHVTQELMKRFRYHRRKGKRIMEACEAVADKMGLDPKTVWAVQNRLQPTTGLATDMLRAGAANLMGRVLRKANVDQAIDLLERANIGVLAPKKDMGGTGGSQFIIGVSADSLGAVKVGVQIGPAQPPKQLPSGPSVNVYTPDELDAEDPTEQPAKVRILPAKPATKPVPVTTLMGSSEPTRLAQARAEERAEQSAQSREKRQIRQRAKAIRQELLGNRKPE